MAERAREKRNKIERGGSCWCRGCAEGHRSGKGVKSAGGGRELFLRCALFDYQSTRKCRERVRKEKETGYSIPTSVLSNDSFLVIVNYLFEWNSIDQAENWALFKS